MSESSRMFMVWRNPGAGRDRIHEPDGSMISEMLEVPNMTQIIRSNRARQSETSGFFLFPRKRSILRFEIRRIRATLAG